MCIHSAHRLIWPFQHMSTKARVLNLNLCMHSPYVAIVAHRVYMLFEHMYICICIYAYIDVCTYVCAYDMHMMFTCMRTRAHTCSHHMHIMCTPCAHLCVITYAQPYAHMCMHTAVQPVYSLYEPMYYSTTSTTVPLEH